MEWPPITRMVSHTLFSPFVDLELIFLAFLSFMDLEFIILAELCGVVYNIENDLANRVAPDSVNDPHEVAADIHVLETVHRNEVRNDTQAGTAKNPNVLKSKHIFSLQLDQEQDYEHED